ncbi:MAG: hypothetical protein M3430_11440 [Acidobacteriota bacterium]|nr:hypothetical protein [Acidobacteriota bacterium]
MRRNYSGIFYSSLLLAGALFAFAPEIARAQEIEQELAKPVLGAATKFDEYGKVGHCDLTARLDNLAVQLQNEPGKKAYIVGFDAPEKGRGTADWQIKKARFYLTRQRGIDPARVMVVDGGNSDVKGGLTELWIVPEGANPPVKLPEVGKYAAKEFSGKFDTYATDENIYRETVEMGFVSADISHTEFAHKMKQQTESVGYLVIRTSKNSPPGAWRRIARRDEHLLQKDYGIETSRHKSIYSGQADGESSQVELWILPKSAPPPVEGVTEVFEEKSSGAFKLNTYDDYNSEGDSEGTDAEKWMLENLAEALRNNPRASGYIIARESVEPEAVDAEEQAADADIPSTATSEHEHVVEAGTETLADANTSKEAEVYVPMSEIAGRWKQTLAEKHGIAAHRITVLEGRSRQWSGGRLTTWVVPEKAQPPDPFARDADDVEEEESPENGELQTEAGEEASLIESPLPER